MGVKDTDSVKKRAADPLDVGFAFAPKIEASRAASLPRGFDSVENWPLYMRKSHWGRPGLIPLRVLLGCRDSKRSFGSDAHCHQWIDCSPPECI